MNYFLDKGLNKAAILFPGLAAAAAATVFGASVANAIELNSIFKYSL